MKNYNLKFKISRLFIIILFSIFYFLFSARALAVGEFSAAYDVTYEVQDSGQTIVIQNIKLTNLMTNYYAKEFFLTFATENIDRVEAWDSSGPLSVEVKKEKDETNIHVIFNEKVIGQGKILNWGFRYRSEEIAKKLGRIWEVNIPRVSQEVVSTVYNVTLVVPSSFGQPAYVFPKPKTGFFWTIEEGSRDGITLGFGDWQGFTFKLTYHLENSSLIPERTHIALPPDTAYQKIVLDRITPSPSEIIVDPDGNWLASYFLLPKQSQDVLVNGFAQVFLTPRSDYKAMDEKMHSEHLKPQKFWEADDPEIRRLADELKTPEAIYNFVVRTLTYNYQRAALKASRLGAKQALISPDKAICMEFTDLFIALARAAGIPAREVDGYAYTQDSRLKPLSLVSDVLHAWPEYWDSEKKIWVQVDPTWGKTSGGNYFNRFDFNHLALVKRGFRSTSPYPAGSYKGRNGGKDVFVEFSSDFFLPKEKAFEIEIIMPQLVLAGLPVEGKILIKNENKVASYGLSPVLVSSPLLPKSSTFWIPVLPPQSSRTVSIKLESPSPLMSGKNTLILKVDNKETRSTFQIISFPTVILPTVLATFVISLLFILIIKKIWRGSYKKT